jgi:RNA ligase
MKYNFPEINNLSDILSHIEGCNEFSVIEKDWYTVVNYMVAFENTFYWDSERPYGSAMRRECRGLIFDTATGQLLSRPYHKFFNVGERDETQLDEIDLNQPHVVLEKLDGSMIRPIPTPEGFRLGTKAGITDVAMNAEVFIGDKPEYLNFIKSSIACSLIPIFEWCSRKNRIVVDYPEDQLILTAVRDNHTGNYIPYSTLVETAKNYNIPVVKAIAGDETDITKVVEHIRKWDDGEGVVVRFQNGHMVKVKADEYVLRHKSKEAISQEKNVINVIVNDSVDDLIPLLTPEDATRLKDFQKAFWMSVEDVATDLHDQYQSLNKGETQKDFALNVQKEIPKYLQNFMFSIHRGIPIKESLVNQITKSLNTQTKVNESRWMWGDLNWNT